MIFTKGMVLKPGERVWKVKAMMTQEQYFDGYMVTWNNFAVWLSKVLQNWKCLIGTRATDHYFEFTYNGDSKELYMDVYRQESGGNTFTVDGE